MRRTIGTGMGAALCLAGWTACGGSSASDGGDTPSQPQVLDMGGTVLKKPVLIALTYPNDPFANQLDQFVQDLPPSSYWSSGSEYGVGAGTVASPIHLTKNLPSSLDDTDLQTDIQQAFADGGELGTLVPQGVYVFFLPSGITITEQGGTSCQDFGGYHNSVTLKDGTPVAYAVVPRCSAGEGFNGLTGLDEVTAAASHEIFESMTDPYYTASGGGAWGNLDAPHLSWLVVFGGEIADLCLSRSDILATPSDLPFVVQRVWSNAAAASLADPCVPAGPNDVPYFNAAPVLPQTVTAEDAAGRQVQTPALILNTGQQATFEVDLFSTKTVGPWTVSAEMLGNSETGNLTFRFDQTSGGNGDKVHLTVTVAQEGSYQGQENIEPFLIVSTLGNTQRGWPVLLVNR